MTAGTLTVTPGKTDKPLVQPMAGELRGFLASLPVGVGKAPLFRKRPTGCPPAMYCWSLM